MTPDQIYRLFLVKRTQVEMLADREYLIPEEEINMFIYHPEAYQPSDELLFNFANQYLSDKNIFSREALSQTYSNNQGDITYVYFTPTIVKERQGVETIAQFINTAQQLGASNAIIISSEEFTPEAQKKISGITKPTIQVFFDYQLYFNPTFHFLTPKHTKISDEDRRKLLAESKIQPSQLLVISIDDPIVRYYGWKIGNIIRIERTNLVTNQTLVKNSISYRIVGRVVIASAKKKKEEK